MRHLPSIGALPVPGTAELFMVIKQDTGGTCFVVSNSPMDWLLEHCSRHTHARDHDIGAWEHIYPIRPARRRPPSRVRHHARQPRRATVQPPRQGSRDVRFRQASVPVP